MIPTAEEFFASLTRYDHQEHVYCPSAEERAIEFAKLHVEAALNAAANKGAVSDGGFQCQVSHYIVDKESILTAYPLDLIK